MIYYPRAKRGLTYRLMGTITATAAATGIVIATCHLGGFARQDKYNLLQYEWHPITAIENTIEFGKDYQAPITGAMGASIAAGLLIDAYRRKKSE